RGNIVGRVHDHIAGWKAVLYRKSSHRHPISGLWFEIIVYASEKPADHGTRHGYLEPLRATNGHNLDVLTPGWPIGSSTSTHVEPLIDGKDKMLERTQWSISDPNRGIVRKGDSARRAAREEALQTFRSFLHQCVDLNVTIRIQRVEILFEPRPGPLDRDLFNGKHFAFNFANCTAGQENLHR